MDHAKQLLQRNDLPQHLNYEELCALIYKHRETLGTKFIQVSLTTNRISFLDLAKYSANNALILLKSRFFNEFKADELAEIYYQHRKVEAFLSALPGKIMKNTAYPNKHFLPPIVYILAIAYKEQSMYRKVVEIIAKSITLSGIVYKELDVSQDKKQHHEHRNAAQLPEKNPYELLELERNASGDEIKKAYRERARRVHPDKVKTLNASRFKEVHEAYELLIDPHKRKAWDDKHPLDSAVPTARNG